MLRGGERGPNYGARDVARAAELTAMLGIARPVLVDCSHANSDKDHRRQPLVLRDVLGQVESGASPILGVMVVRLTGCASTAPAAHSISPTSRTWPTASCG